MEQISVSGTSFLERVHCAEKSSVPRCFFSRHNSLFSLVLIFPPFWVKSLRSQTLVTCGTTSASAKEMHMHLSEAAKVLGFPKSCARTKNLCKAPHLAGTFRTECVGVDSRATHVIRLVHMHAPTPTQCHRLVPA